MIIRTCFLMAVVAVLSVPVTADTTNADCAAAFDQCLKQCDIDHTDDAGAKAACVPTCSGKYAACDAGVAYDKAKPWIEEQAGKTKKFLDDLLDGLKKETPDSTQDGPGKSI